MAPSLNQKPKWLRRISYILLFLAVSTVLGFVGARSANAAAANSSGVDTSEGLPPNVASIAEYMGKDPNAPLPSYVSLVGINAFHGQGSLASGQRLSGLSVISVDPFSPAEDAGLRGAHLPALPAAMEVGVGVLIIGAILAFPPAALGIGLIPKLRDAKAYDVIVAVDAERTRDISDLEASLRKAKAGETIYLTVIRDGQREQLRVVAPVSFDSTP